MYVPSYLHSLWNMVHLESRFGRGGEPVVKLNIINIGKEVSEL